MTAGQFKDDTMNLRDILSIFSRVPKPPPIPKADYDPTAVVDAAAAKLDRTIQEGLGVTTRGYVLVFTNPPPLSVVQYADVVLRVDSDKTVYVEKSRISATGVAAMGAQAACNFLLRPFR